MARRALTPTNTIVRKEALSDSEMECCSYTKKCWTFCGFFSAFAAFNWFCQLNEATR